MAYPDHRMWYGGPCVLVCPDHWMWYRVPGVLACPDHWMWYRGRAQTTGCGIVVLASWRAQTTAGDLASPDHRMWYRGPGVLACPPHQMRYHDPAMVCWCVLRDLIIIVSLSWLLGVPRPPDVVSWSWRLGVPRPPDVVSWSWSLGVPRPPNACCILIRVCSLYYGDALRPQDPGSWIMGSWWD